LIEVSLQGLGFEVRVSGVASPLESMVAEEEFLLNGEVRKSLETMTLEGGDDEAESVIGSAPGAVRDHSLMQSILACRVN
jgi:hypothetical protein